MVPTPIPAQTIADAKAAALDSMVRFKTGDYSVTDTERDAYKALIGALKAAGVTSPFMEILDKMPGTVNFRSESLGSARP